MATTRERLRDMRQGGGNDATDTLAKFFRNVFTSAASLGAPRIQQDAVRLSDSVVDLEKEALEKHLLKLEQELDLVEQVLASWTAPTETTHRVF